MIGLNSNNNKAKQNLNNWKSVFYNCRKCKANNSLWGFDFQSSSQIPWEINICNTI